MNPIDDNFTQQLVGEILTGLRDGLTKFSGPSRVALIYQLQTKDELHICDPHSLLRGHELKIRSTYFDKKTIPIDTANTLRNKPYSHIEQITKLDLDGIISFGGQSGPVTYQMWFTDHHPEILSTGPTERWLEHAVLRFSHDVANERELYTGISGRFLREYSTHAVCDQIVYESARNANSYAQFLIYPVINAVLEISKIREEQRSPHGELIFVDPRVIDSLEFMARFSYSELPLLDNYKHVRKLLQAVQKFRNRLVSDGTHIIGIASGRVDHFNITADFRGLFGLLKLNDQSICSYADGAYSSAAHQAKLFEVEETLLDYNLDSTIRNSLFHIVSSIVHFAETELFGCSIVLDLNEPLTQIAGQDLEQPLDLERSNLLDLACNLARVDGALQICKDRHLHRFACLFDGPRIEGEDRARGARYNSALRFTARKPHTVIVVVSSDRPVSVIQNGMEYRSSCSLRPGLSSDVKTQRLIDWLDVL